MALLMEPSGESGHPIGEHVCVLMYVCGVCVCSCICVICVCMWCECVFMYVCVYKHAHVCIW